jgi:hypothetical protein
MLQLATWTSGLVTRTDREREESATSSRPFDCASRQFRNSEMPGKSFVLARYPHPEVFFIDSVVGISLVTLRVKPVWENGPGISFCDVICEVICGC